MKTKILFLILITISLSLAQGRRGGGRQMTWDESLNLTTEQMQEITALREAMQPAMQGIQQTTRTLEMELRQLTRNGDSDAAARIAELEAAISANETAMTALMEGHRSQIRELLTPDQQLVFDQHQFGPRHERGSQRGGRMGDDANGSRGNGSGHRPGRGRR